MKPIARHEEADLPIDCFKAFEIFDFDYKTIVHSFSDFFFQKNPKLIASPIVCIKDVILGNLTAQQK